MFLRAVFYAFIVVLTFNFAASAEPIVIGESFTLPSKSLNETRRINVYRAPSYGEAENAARPVLYMLDGGAGEDFLHVAGLLQVSIANGTMRPYLLVGIENTQRRRDTTGPTTVESDRKIAPVVGGSAAFRTFIRDELIPKINSQYATTAERAILGESLAGLFVVETLMLEPTLFNDYVAIDPALWWNNSQWLNDLSRLKLLPVQRQLFLAGSNVQGNGEIVAQFAQKVAALNNTSLRLVYKSLPNETHGTIYHPAALLAVREIFPPKP